MSPGFERMPGPMKGVMVSSPSRTGQPAWQLMAKSRSSAKVASAIETSSWGVAWLPPTTTVGRSMSRARKAAAI